MTGKTYDGLSLLGSHRRNRRRAVSCTSADIYFHGTLHERQLPKHGAVLR